MGLPIQGGEEANEEAWEEKTTKLRKFRFICAQGRGWECASLGLKKGGGGIFTHIRTGGRKKDRWAGGARGNFEEEEIKPSVPHAPRSNDT